MSQSTCRLSCIPHSPSYSLILASHFPTESTGIFKCDLCKISFNTQQECSEHILSHFKRQQCDSCGKIIYKICNLIFELHSVASDCCRPTSTSSHQNNGADVVTSSNRVGSVPTQIINLMDKELELITAPVKNGTSGGEGLATSRRYSSRMTKKVCYNSHNDDVPMKQWARVDDSGNYAVAKLEISPVDDNDTYSSESLIKQEHLDESTTDDGWSIDGQPPLRTDRPEGAISADEILDGGTADEEDYLPVGVPKSRKIKQKTPRPLNIPCSECRTLFRTQRSLQIHQRAEHGINPSTECDICKKVFTSVGNLKQHKQTHNDTRRYICSYCGKGFNLHFNLKDHMNEHTGEKPYVCGVCGKAFGKASHRVAHMRVYILSLQKSNSIHTNS